MHGKESTKIEFVTSDCFLLQNGQWLTLNNLKQSGIDRASECGRYPCRSLFAAMDGDEEALQALPFPEAVPAKKAKLEVSSF